MNTDFTLSSFSNEAANRKRVSMCKARQQESKERTCMFGLLLLILLLVAALYVEILFIFRQCSCEISTGTNKDVNLSLDLQSTSSLLSAQKKTIGSRGNGFIVLFMKVGFNTTKTIYVTSENGVQMNISTSPRLNTTIKAKIDRNINTLSSQHIILPPELELQSFRKEVKSVLIETSSDVFVFSHIDGVYNAGGTTHIPLHKLSTKYVVISVKPVSLSQLAVSAIQDNTMISITFNIKQNFPFMIEGKTFYDGDVFTFYLDRFETYQVEHYKDLTGTFIESSDPIAVFSGNDCNGLDNFGGCDHFIVQLPPIDSVDKTYIVPPNSDDRNTVIRITAIGNSTITYTIGTISQHLYLYKFKSFNVIITSNETCYIRSDAPIIVTAFGLHSKSSSMGDSTMTIVPGISQYLDYYKIAVPYGYDHNYVSIIINLASKDSFRINGTIIDSRNIVFEENVSAGNITYNVRSISVVEGELTASTMDRECFGLMFAGVTEYEAYGFSGNYLLL